MNLKELQKAVNDAIIYALECKVDPENVEVTIQIEGPGYSSFHAHEDMKLHYDNDTQASGCVILAHKE